MDGKKFPPKKVIIPKGTINPNETTVIEIPEELKDEPSLIASPKIREKSGPSSSNRYTPVKKMYRKVVRTTISDSSFDDFAQNVPCASSTIEDESSLGILHDMPESSICSCGSNSSLGLLSSRFLDTPPTFQSSLGILNSADMRTTQSCGRNTRSSQPTNQSLGILRSSYMNRQDPFPSSCPGSRSSQPTNQSLGILRSSYMNRHDSFPSSCTDTRNTSKCPFNSVRSNTRNSQPTNDSLGILRSSYMNRTSPFSYGQNTSTNQSLGILPSCDMNSTQPTNESLGLLSSRYMNSSQNYSNTSLGLLPSECLKTASSGTCPGASRVLNASPLTRSNVDLLDNCSPPPGLYNDSESQHENVNEALEVLEAHERATIERDVRNLQRARRQLVKDAATMSKRCEGK